MPERLISGGTLYLLLRGETERDLYDEAVYDYAADCAEAERAEDGYLKPEGGTLWALGYALGFFGVGEELVVVDNREEAEERFVDVFQDAWEDVR